MHHSKEAAGKALFSILRAGFRAAAVRVTRALLLPTGLLCTQARTAARSWIQVALQSQTRLRGEISQHSVLWKPALRPLPGRWGGGWGWRGVPLALWKAVRLATQVFSF